MRQTWRGEVWWVDFDPVGGELRKTRPAVIVSNDGANKFLNRLQVVPMTSQIDRVYPSEALVRVNDRENKAMADQIATVSKKRLTTRLGKLSDRDLIKVERAIVLQLGLTDLGGQ